VHHSAWGDPDSFGIQVNLAAGSLNLDQLAITPWPEYPKSPRRRNRADLPLLPRNSSQWLTVVLPSTEWICIGLLMLANVSVLEPGLMLMVPPLATALTPEASNF
jgi:hypothetical protein